MFRFLVVMTLVFGAYSVGKYDSAPQAAPGRNRGITISTMRANDDGMASDVSAIVRDGMSEVGDAVGAKVRNAATQSPQSTQGTDALAEDLARMASRVARKVAGEVVIRMCPSIGLACAFPDGA